MPFNLTLPRAAVQKASAHLLAHKATALLASICECPERLHGMGNEMGGNL